MNRRAFLRATTGGAAALAAAGASAPALSAGLAALSSPTGVPVLFDGRFATARDHAVRLAGGHGSLQPVSGDVTELMQAFAAGRGPRRLIGVTPESVPFCLSELAPRNRRPLLTLRRLDQDLFAWHLVHAS